MDFRRELGTYGEIDHGEELSITGDLTVEFWLYLRRWPESWTEIISKFVSDEENEFCFRLKDGQRAQWYFGKGEAFAKPVDWVPQEDMRLHEWVHVACVRKVGEYGRIYFDGVLRREEDWSGEPEAAGTEAIVRLMAHSDGKRFNDGKLSEVRIWNRARSADEIRQGMYEALTGDEPGLVGVWHGSDDGVLVDAVGHHDGRSVMADTGKERLRVGVCGWELSHNAAGRAYTLAQLYGGWAEVELIGCLFPRYGGQVWEPIRGTQIPCHRVTVADEGRFVEQALGLVLAHPYEVVHLSKPRIPNIVLGLLYKLVWGARVIVDIDDEELAFVKASEPVNWREFLGSGEQLPKWKHLDSQKWTRIAVGLAQEFDGVTVSNPALQERYGGVVIRHARDEGRFVPSSEGRRQSRERLGIAPDKKVVLFLGTPKEYKGLVTTARALASLGRQDVVFAIIGDFTDGGLKEKLQGISGVDYVFVGNQPFEQIPDVVAAGDICVLLQDSGSPVSRFQIPAKLSDALGMGLVVLLSETAAVADVIESGAVVPVAEGNLAGVLGRLLSEPAEMKRLGALGRELLAAEFGFEVNISRLAGVVEGVRDSAEVLSEGFDLLWAGFPAVGSVWSGLVSHKTITKGKKIIVYTCNFGNYESVKEPMVIDPRVEYILFTDRKDMQSKTWKIIYINELAENPRRASRLAKILPHKYLPDHDISVYLDSTFTVKEPDIYNMVERCMGDSDIALYKHSERNCVYDEIDFCETSEIRNVDSETCSKIRAKYQSINYPRKNGLFENGFIFRQNNSKIKELNELWWSEYVSGAERDQFSLMYCLHLLNVKPNSIKIGKQMRDNPFIEWKPHKYKDYSKNNYKNFTKSSPLKIAVCVHIFYEHIWEKICKYITNINVDYDLFITCPVEKIFTVSTVVKKNYPKAHIETVENFGMDVAPFIHCVKKFALWNYDLVLKLHTKNDRSILREEQGNILFQGTLGTEDLVNQILNAFSADAKLGMVGPDYLYRSAQYLMYGNRYLVDQFQKYLYLENHKGDWGFFAGTMFWIRGSLLQSLADASRLILKFFTHSEPMRTGGDGSPAHSFERLFGLLPWASGMKTGLTYRCNSDATQFMLQIPKIENLLQSSLRYSCTTDHLIRSKKANDWAKIISKSDLSDLFDANFYLKNCTDMSEIATNSPATHFVLYGDVDGCDPSPNFSTAYYILRYKDVRHRKLPALVHYITCGIKERRKVFPSQLDWLELAEKENLFSEAWYKANYPSACLNGLSPKDSYLINGWLQCRATSKNFNPKLLPVVDEMFKVIQKDPLELYLSKHALSEYSLYDAISRAFDNNDFYIVSQILVDKLHQKFGETRASLEALGTSLILQKKWDEARQVWEKVWFHFLNKNFVERYKSSVVPYDQNDANRKSNFKAVEPSQFDTQDICSYRVCIYTSLYGDRDELLPILSDIPGIDYICFTDKLRSSFGWQLRVIDPGLQDNNLNAKIFKILPHKYLQEYDYSLFVDANTLFMGRINDLIKKCLSSDFVMWKHPVRNDVYWEIATIMAHRRHGPDGLIDQIETYSDSGLPRESGLVEGSFIWRKHTNQMIASFMEEWWKHIRKYTRRDQVSLGYLMWRNGLRPYVLPDELGTSRNNIYFTKTPHKNSPYKVDTNPTNRSGSKTLSFKNADVIFLYHPQFATSGSTVMRGKQLSSLVRENVLDNRSVFYTSDDQEVSGKILFLTKGYLQLSTPELLENLKKRDNIILADFVDSVPKPEIVDFIDVMVAASFSAYIDYSKKWPKKNLHYVRHHVDPRISMPKYDNLSKATRIGYFGEIVNTIKSDKIADSVDFYRVDTSTDNSTDWLAHISEYNCHYAVRKTRKIDHHKPFTKGFVAAHCEANIIIQESATDVKYYLGVDYPYLLPDNPDEGEVLYMLQRVKEEYRGSEWNYGLKIMKDVRERSSSERVINDFNYLLANL
nr:rhamnan synthesis F family protein [Arthrospira sp. SH-MAG29]